MKEINFTNLLNRRGNAEPSHNYELSETEKYFVRYTEDFFTYKQWIPSDRDTQNAVIEVIRCLAN